MFLFMNSAWQIKNSFLQLSFFVLKGFTTCFNISTLNQTFFKRIKASFVLF